MLLNGKKWAFLISTFCCCLTKNLLGYDILWLLQSIRLYLNVLVAVDFIILQFKNQKCKLRFPGLYLWVLSRWIHPKASKTHFGFTNMGSDMHTFKDIAIWFAKLYYTFVYSWTPVLTGWVWVYEVIYSARYMYKEYSKISNFCLESWTPWNFT